MFFQELLSLLKGDTKLRLDLSANGEELTVVVQPMGCSSSDAMLRVPLVITATAAELDAEFASALTDYTAARQSLAQQVEATNAAIQAATKEAAGKQAKASKAPASAPMSQPVSEIEPDELPVGDEAAHPAEAQALSAGCGPTPTASAPAQGGLNLANLL